MTEQLGRSTSTFTSQSPMENVLSQQGSWEPSWKEHLKACCRPTYNLRMLKNKGAIIVLIHNYLAFSLFTYLLGQQPKDKLTPHYITWSLTIPLLGWLADVRIGRHNLIRWSIWIMWIAFMLATVSSVVASFVTFDTEIITIVLLTMASAGFGGHQANVIQYGLDQLQDASTDEITAFISWYAWTAFSAGVVTHYTYTCIYEEYLILSRVAVSFFLTVALIMTFYTKHILIREPVTQNPFKLVYNVLKYAIKNKRPRCRSAFTYCEDELPSRIDFGKSKYGGPFTIEQVEDVKTFFRLLLFIFFCCSLPTIVITVDQFTHQMDNLINFQISDLPTRACYLQQLYINHTTYYIVSVLIPVYEFFVYPILRRHFSWIKSHFKILLGILLQMARILALMAFNFNVRHTYLDNYGHNFTLKCAFSQEAGVLVHILSRKWLILPDIISSSSVATFVIGGIELICAQTPYSMRGLMFGTVYGGFSVYASIAYGIAFPFMREPNFWGTRTISCGFWFLFFNLVALMISAVYLSVAGILYKKKREKMCCQMNRYLLRESTVSICNL